MSTKIHATVDANGKPTGIHLTGGQASDLIGADLLLPNNPGRTLIADKAYDAVERVIKPALQAGKQVVIPSIRDHRPQRQHDRNLYRLRCRIEHFFARLKQFRSIATRYDKTALNFFGAVQLACAFLWLN